MGTKYSSQTISGYNASPPADDGSTAASNQVAWAKHLSKIGNPLKTLAENINTALLTALSTTVRTITSNDSTTAADHLCTVQIASTVTTAAITVSLMDATTATNGYIVTVNNQSTIAHTIGVTTASNTINSSTASISILPMQSIVFTVNAAATGFIAMRSDYADYASVAAHATTCNIWQARTIQLTGGAVTFTAFPNAPFVGATSQIVCNAAHIFTAGANMIIPGIASGSNFTAAANTTIEVVALTTSQFLLNVLNVFPAVITNTLGADVTLNNTGAYFTGPTVAQGTSGTWVASGNVTCIDSAGGAVFYAKLWDGTTVISSGLGQTTAVNNQVTISLSGYIASPAGNIRISVIDVSSTSGKIVYNSTLNTHDSTLTAYRIA